MNTERAEELVRAAVCRVAPDADLDSLDPDDDLREALELDSLDFLQVVEQLSERSGVRIDEEDYPQLSTWSGAVRWISRATDPALET